MKEMCHLLFLNSPSLLSSLCLSLCGCFCFTHCLWSSFWGAEGFIVSFCVCLSVSLFSPSLSFCLFKISSLASVSAPTQKVWANKMNHLSYKLVCKEAGGRCIGVGHICCKLFWAWTSAQYRHIYHINSIVRRLSIFSWHKLRACKCDKSISHETLIDL